MNKALVWAAILLAGAPSAAAHGAPEPRELDARILVDGTSAGDYGACLQGQCLADDGPWDLLALDGREAATAEGEPALWLRILVQSNNLETERAITFHLTTPAGERSLHIEMAGTEVTAHDFDTVLGPEDVGDGHPKAYDATVRLATLGIQPGATITGIRVESSAGSEDGDVMPGTWSVRGQAVPGAPTEPSEAGAWPTRGPARLLEASIDAPVVALGSTVNVTLVSNLNETSQFAQVRLGNATPVSVKLDPGASRTVTLPTQEAGAHEVVVTSDLGAYAALALTVQAPPAPPPAQPEPGSQDDPGTTKGSPAPAAVLLACLALALVWGRRR